MKQRTKAVVCPGIWCFSQEDDFEVQLVIFDQTNILSTHKINVLPNHMNYRGFFIILNFQNVNIVEIIVAIKNVLWRH